MLEEFTFFWSGEFSQWYMRDIIIDNITYNCAEQYMMHQKALLFGDTKIAQKVMEAAEPREQKKLGRKVKNFDMNKWGEVAQDIVYKASIAKYTQHEDLKSLLLNTGTTTLVEASPYDKVWGIGLKEDNPLAQDRATWKGTNWLGEVLTSAREDIKNGEF